MIIRLVTRAVVEVVVPFGVSKAGYLSGCPRELGQVVQGSYLDAYSFMRVLTRTTATPTVRLNVLKRKP